MPVSVRCDELQSGMFLHEPVIWHDRVMLPGGRELTETDVSVLRRRFPEMCVRVGEPVLDELVEFEDDSRDREVAAMVKAKITDALRIKDPRFARHASMKDVDFGAVRATVDEIMKYLEANPVSAALLARTLSKDTYLADRTANVFFLSMVLGSTVREYVSIERQRQSKARELQSTVTMDLTPLGLGVMFMDIGLAPLQALFGADEPLTAADHQAIREHPLVVLDMLPPNFSAAAKTIIRTHHENLAGIGYPYGIPKDKLHVLARVVRIADAFETATARDVFKQAVSPVRAIWEMLAGPTQHCFDPKLMRVFVRVVAPFPICAKLQLDDGRQAVVVKYNRTNPFKPIATIAYDAGNKPLPKADIQSPVTIDPADGLKIKSYNGEDVSYIYGPALPVETAEEPAQPETLFDYFYP